MNDFQKEKLKRFANDELMKTTVKNVIFNSFVNTKPPSSTHLDIHYLAASRIAMSLLEQAFNEIDTYKNDEEEKISNARQIGM